MTAFNERNKLRTGEVDDLALRKGSVQRGFESTAFYTRFGRDYTERGGAAELPQDVDARVQYA